jgi:hypothetical protein
MKRELHGCMRKRNNVCTFVNMMFITISAVAVTWVCAVSHWNGYTLDIKN